MLYFRKHVRFTPWFSCLPVDFDFFRSRAESSWSEECNHNCDVPLWPTRFSLGLLYSTLSALPHHYLVCRGEPPVTDVALRTPTKQGTQPKLKIGQMPLKHCNLWRRGLYQKRYQYELEGMDVQYCPMPSSGHFPRSRCF